jgi:EAL domain-containing protein (putative c-di-GMP-specific phosphodiesterase class I)
MNSKTGRIEGAEALTRIVDNTGKIIPPSLFIPIAEKNGMINQLGDQAFEQTCRFIKEKDVAGRGISFINVNLSPIQFMRTDIAEKLEGYVRKYGIDPEFIHLEITEEALIDETLLLKQMQALISKGFCFALDDYGKGYSNLSRLRHCPFINIKLDMSLVWDYCRKPDEMVPSMVDTFKKMGFSITAEGIEDGNMAEDMSEVGVNYLQGFHFSKPIPMEDFESRYLQTSG